MQRTRHRFTLPLLTALPFAAVTATQLTPSDGCAAFKAAGFTLRGKDWRSDLGDGSPPYTQASLDKVADLNGDGRPEALIGEGGGNF